jgi:flagellar basal-body rod modification protein FlgD
MANNINAVNAASSTTSSAAIAAKTADDGQDRFLKLLVSQMKNQDPLNPMDNAQVTSQMAQISTVSGIDRLNTSIVSMMSQFAGMEAVQGASLAGRDVLVAGNGLTLAGGAAAGGFELPAAADQTQITVYDRNGQAVHTTQLGVSPAGIHRFEWDGMTEAGQKAADGQYTFKVKTTTSGTEATAQGLTLGPVGGVSRGAAGLELDLGALGTRALADIKRIQ